MTIMHIINFSIPIAFIAISGFLLDRACMPVKSEQKKVKSKV